MFNNRMSSIRESMEWGFADIVRLWASLDFVPSQRLFFNPLGVQFRVATLLTSIQICIYGLQGAQYLTAVHPDWRIIRRNQVFWRKNMYVKLGVETVKFKYDTI